MWEAVADEAELSFLDVLLDGVSSTVMSGEGSCQIKEETGEAYKNSSLEI